MSQPKFSSILRETKLLTFTFAFLKKSIKMKRTSLNIIIIMLIIIISNAIINIISIIIIAILLLLLLLLPL